VIGDSIHLICFNLNKFEVFVRKIEIDYNGVIPDFVQKWKKILVGGNGHILEDESTLAKHKFSEIGKIGMFASNLHTQYYPQIEDKVNQPIFYLVNFTLKRLYFLNSQFELLQKIDFNFVGNFAKRLKLLRPLDEDVMMVLFKQKDDIWYEVLVSLRNEKFEILRRAEKNMKIYSETFASGFDKFFPDLRKFKGRFVSNRFKLFKLGLMKKNVKAFLKNSK
jgi:hypothetical protein